MALWGGRFTGSAASAAATLSRSVHFDWRLAPYDLRSSIAHASGLEKGGILTKDEAGKIKSALKQLMAEVESGNFEFKDSDEDVHSALERGLIEKLSDLGGKLRAGRSRNDQVATDLKLYAIDHVLEISKAIIDLQKALLEKSKEYADAPAPGSVRIVLGQHR